MNNQLALILNCFVNDQLRFLITELLYQLSTHLTIELFYRLLYHVIIKTCSQLSNHIFVSVISCQVLLRSNCFISYQTTSLSSLLFKSCYRQILSIKLCYFKIFLLIFKSCYLKGLSISNLFYQLSNHAVLKYHHQFSLSIN